MGSDHHASPCKVSGILMRVILTMPPCTQDKQAIRATLVTYPTRQPMGEVARIDRNKPPLSIAPSGNVPTRIPHYYGASPSSLYPLKLQMNPFCNPITSYPYANIGFVRKYIVAFKKQDGEMSRSPCRSLQLLYIGKVRSVSGRVGRYTSHGLQNQHNRIEKNTFNEPEMWQNVNADSMECF